MPKNPANIGFYTGTGPGAPEVLSIKMTGMEELKAKLRQLSDIGKVKATEEALKAGGNIIKDSIKAKAPLGTTETVTKGGFRFAPGSLKRSILVRKKRDKWDPYNIKFQVGPDKKIAFYAHMVEFGTSLHAIKPKKGKFLKFRRTSGGTYRPEFISEQTYTEAITSEGRKVGGGFVFIKGIEVAAKKHPFVRPGFDSSKFRALEAIKQKLLVVINKIAKKEGVA